MTVHSLIKALQNYPQDYEVIAFDIEDGCYPIGQLEEWKQKLNYETSDFNPDMKAVLLTCNGRHF